MTTTSDRKLKVAIVGLGRMGSIHATNFSYKVPRAQVVAVCDVRAESLQWANENLPAGVRGYTDVEDMFKTSGAEATLIVTETSRHAPLAELAMSHGLVSIVFGTILGHSLLARLTREAYRRGCGNFATSSRNSEEIPQFEDDGSIRASL